LSTPCCSSGSRPIALIEDGDEIEVDLREGKKALNFTSVSEAELAARRENWAEPAEKYTHGVLHKYYTLVGSASNGATLERREEDQFVSRALGSHKR